MMVAALQGIFVNPSDVSGTDAAPPADRSTVDGTRYHRLVEDLQRFTAC